MEYKRTVLKIHSHDKKYLMLTHTYQTLNFVTTVNFKLQGQLYKTRQLYKKLDSNTMWNEQMPHQWRGLDWLVILFQTSMCITTFWFMTVTTSDSTLATIKTLPVSKVDKLGGLLISSDKFYVAFKPWKRSLFPFSVLTPSQMTSLFSSLELIFDFL